MPKDMQQIMQQAQQMQQQMLAAQEALAHKTFEGSAGGGVVKAVVKGTGELLSIDFDASVLDQLPSLRLLGGIEWGTLAPGFERRDRRGERR